MIVGKVPIEPHRKHLIKREAAHTHRICTELIGLIMNEPQLETMAECA